MLDYGIFYEFIPVGENQDSIIDIQDVKLFVEYELVITTNGGLWRYRIGDVVRFTSLYPFRIQITGRTKHFINAFGEEVVDTYLKLKRKELNDFETENVFDKEGSITGWEKNNTLDC